MKKLLIIAFALVCLSEVFGEPIYKGKTQSEWITQLLDGKKLSVDVQSNIQNLHQYFTIKTIQTQVDCDDTDGSDEMLCYIELILKKPLTLSGTLHIKNIPFDSECAPQSGVYFIPQDKHFAFLANSLIGEIQSTMAKTLPNQPAWYQGGAGGELSYEATITLQNQEDSNIIAGNGDDCTISGAPTLNAKVITSTLKLANPYTYKYYKEFKNLNVELVSSDEYVNLRASPNGKIITQMKMKDQHKALLLKQHFWNLQKQEWIEVYYFPPKAKDSDLPMVGVVHISQIKSKE